MIIRKQHKQGSFFIFIVCAVVVFWGSGIIPGFFVAIGTNFFPEYSNDASRREILLLEARIKSLEEERRISEGFFDNNDVGNNSPIPAYVQLGPGYLFLDTILLRAGTRQGIKEGSMVITAGGIFVGRITEVGDWWSRVEVPGALGVKTTVRAGARKEFVFEVVGVGAGEMKTELPAALSLAIGDTIWTGESPLYPLGLIDDVAQGEAQQLRTVIIRSPFQHQTLYRLFVIL